MEEFNEAFREITLSDKLKDRERRGGWDSAGMCEVVRFRRCSWQVLCTRLLLDCGILFEPVRYMEVVRITFEHVEGSMSCCSATLGYTGPLSDCIVKSHWSGLTRRWVLSPQRKLRGWRHRLRRIAAADKMRERRRSSASSAALRDGRNLKCKIGLFCDQLGFSTGLWQSALALSSPSWQGNRPGA